MMKIYFVVQKPTKQMFNHYIASLGNALQRQGCEVAYGPEILWTDEVFDFDVIHLQWPEGIFGLEGHQVTGSELTRMEERLKELKVHGKLIVATCHNLKPHTNKNPNVLRLYEIIYSHCDVVHHLGAYSRDILAPQYPGANHVVIPHHIYDDFYSFDIPQEEARKRLHLPAEGKIVLSFGRFRTDNERNFVLSLRKNFYSQSSSMPSARPTTSFLIPGFYRESLHTRNPKKLAVRLYNTIKYKLMGIKFCNEVLPDDLMQCYFCAADVVLIQRVDALNSGNLPMAFHAGKVVVGPNVGNVGAILHETGNFTFDPQVINSAATALHIALTQTAKGKVNRTYASEHWASDIVASSLLNYYQQPKQ